MRKTGTVERWTCFFVICRGGMGKKRKHKLGESCIRDSLIPISTMRELDKEKNSGHKSSTNLGQGISNAETSFPDQTRSIGASRQGRHTSHGS